ncbi:MAG: M14 family metallopeptidase [Woeseiaceae bacterium]|nr:M14 family metallopeptidase [Woeseiaceae bacterium]
MNKLLLATLLLAPLAFADDEIDFWPGASYDPAVPTIESVVGHAPGERITWVHDAIRYFEALESAMPDQVSVHRYAQSWEGRDLIYVIISSAENMARIDEVKAGMQALRDPGRTTPAEAAEIIESQPAVTWLSYSVHGNEISSTDAAMLTAYHLLAARGEDRIDQILEETVVVIDPIQNPDGRDRFIHSFEMAEGLVPLADRLAAEHDEPWPSGRVNHYLFDMNRDWFILSQPETQGRVAAIQEFYPVAFVDAHEMGSDQTYYFAPEAVPFNPHLADDQRASLELFGRTNARWFDRFGIDYFTREIFDAFYPGYGASWPSYFGSVAMTYEQASARGLVIRKYDGSDMSYAETVRNHFVTSLGTAETTAANRQKLLEDFYNYQRSAIAEGSREAISAYVLPTQNDQAGANKLAALLVRQGVEVGMATEDFRACGQSFGAGSYVINLAQPAKRLIRTLLDVDVPIDEAFMKEQERRRAKGLPDEIYDVTAWSLPLMMNLESVACSRAVSVATTPASSDFVQPGSVSGGEASVAYLVPWGEATAARFLAHAFRNGLTVKSADMPFTHEGRRYSSGTLIIDVADNPDNQHQMIRHIAELSGANVVAVDDSWVTDGPNFGSGNVVRHTPPTVAIAWDRPTSQYSAGNTRFVIERQFDYPVTPIRTARIATSDLGNYDVLILPEARGAGYAPVLGEAGIQNLKDWVAKGGILIAVGNANRFVADANVDIASIRRESAVIETDDDGKSGGGKGDGGGDEPADPTVEGSYLESADDYAASITPERKDPDSVGGVLVNASVDPDHWLGAGVAETLHVLVRGSDIYTPVRLDKGTNVARFTSADELLTSGYLWEQNKKQLAFKPFAVVQPHQRGYVISFTQDPNVRAYLDGLNVIFMNAIFRGSAHARPAR